MPVTAVGVVPEKELTGKQAVSQPSHILVPSLLFLLLTASSDLLYHHLLLLLLFSGMFKHYLITRLSEQDEVLRARYIANEKIFALVLGIVPEGDVLLYAHFSELPLIFKSTLTIIRWNHSYWQ